MFEIKNRWDGSVVYRSVSAETLTDAVLEAVRSGASLADASLDGASLDRASLDGARLDRASLVGARLDGARLDGARLDRASLVGARLDPIRDDLFQILAAAPAEVRGLLAALRAGKVDGSTYTGECACLVGTIANVRGCKLKQLGIEPDSDRPAEMWFLAIHPGHTPQNHPVAAITESWVLAWLEANQPASRDVIAADAELAARIEELTAKRHALFVTGNVERIRALAAVAP